MRFKRRSLVLAIAAFLIVGLVVFKRLHPKPLLVGRGAAPASKRPAPVFEALDADNRLVKFERYLGRHRILLVFFDGEAGPDRDETLLRLRSEFDRIESTGTVVVAISAALPQQNRRAFQRGGAFPFPILTDASLAPNIRRLAIHRDWGRLDDSTGQLLTGVFLIDRASNVAWRGNAPEPLADPQAGIDRLVKGEPYDE